MATTAKDDIDGTSKTLPRGVAILRDPMLNKGTGRTVRVSS